jgi:hypothetical protein
MTTRRKRQKFGGTSMGVSSIIAILVILVLVVFSALSITTSRADYALSQKTAVGTRAFYDADCIAEEQMALVAETIRSSASDWEESLPSNFSVRTDAGAKVVAYTVPIDDNRDISVELLVDKDGSLTRQRWQVVSSGEWIPDESLDLYIPK